MAVRQKDLETVLGGTALKRKKSSSKRKKGPVVNSSFAETVRRGGFKGRALAKVRKKTTALLSKPTIQNETWSRGRKMWGFVKR